MFGYVRPLKGELKVSEWEAYQAAYCGLCQCLGAQYGYRSRFLVSYDLTFLYCLMTCRQREQAAAVCRCPANPLRRKKCLSASADMAHAAGVNVLLMYHKLRDTAADEAGIKRLAAKAAQMFYRRPYRKAAAQLPELDALMHRQLSALAELEQTRCTSIDRTADAFAKILAACGSSMEDEAAQRASKEVLYYVGRYLYLTDALDDLQKDLAAGAYNPVAARYGIQAGHLSPENTQALINTIQLSISRAAAALELLEPLWCGGILRNIIYWGLPAVLQSVRNGTFENKQFRSKT